MPDSCFRTHSDSDQQRPSRFDEIENASSREARTTIVANSSLSSECISIDELLLLQKPNPRIVGQLCKSLHTSCVSSQIAFGFFFNIMFLL